MGCCRSPREYNTVDGAEDAPSFRLCIIKSNFNDKSLRSNFCTRVVCCVCFSFRHRSVLFLFLRWVCLRAARERESGNITTKKRLIFSPRPYQSARQIFYVAGSLSFACSRHKDNVDGTYSLNADYTYNFKQNICARLIRPLCCRQTKLCV